MVNSNKKKMALMVNKATNALPSCPRLKMFFLGSLYSPYLSDSPILPDKSTKQPCKKLLRMLSICFLLPVRFYYDR